jgi:hypothetical protein
MEEGPLNTYALLHHHFGTVGIINTHEGMFTMELCKELHKECIITYKDQQSVQVCYNLPKTYPEELNMESPSIIVDRAAAGEVPEVAAAYVSLSDETTSLTSFEYIPVSLAGIYEACEPVAVGGFTDHH